MHGHVAWFRAVVYLGFLVIAAWRLWLVIRRGR